MVDDTIRPDARSAHRVRTPVAFVLVTAAALATAPAATAGVSAWARTVPTFAAADSLLGLAAWGAARARLDSITAVARARHDRGMELVGLIRTARWDAEAGRPAVAAAAIDSILPEVTARRDTMLLCRAITTRGRADELRRRPQEALAHYRRAARLAARARMPSEEGRVRLQIADQAVDGGQSTEAVTEYRRALRLLTGPDDRRSRLAARAGLGRALDNTGDVDGARREYVAVLAEAASLGDRNTLANTEFNLGVLEQDRGDPSLAPQHYAAAEVIGRQLNRRDLVMSVARALSVYYLRAGQDAQADSVLSRALPEAERSRDPSTRAILLSQFGILRRQQGRLEEGIAYERRAIALSDSVPVRVAVTMTMPHVFSLHRAGRFEEALSVLKAQRDRFGARLDDTERRDIARSEAYTLLALQRPREAMVALRGVLASSDTAGVRGENYLLALVAEARCLTALGARDSALAAFARIATRWERLRAAQSDPGWRERIDNAAAEFAGAYGMALLDPARGGTPGSRAREAFETLQRFRARTLGERISASGRSRATAAPSFSLAAFQRRGLRPGEVFVDVQAGRDTTVVFAVTRDTVRAWGASRQDDLAGRLGRLGRLVADPTAETPELRASAAASLGAELFGPAAAEVARARRVVVAAGSLAQYPLGCLTAPGAAAPLVVERELDLMPSAALLLRARSATRPADTHRRALLAVAFVRDDAGHIIPDAAKEARWLAGRFADADARIDDRQALARLTASLGGYQALHFATHMRENRPRPWQSAMYLGGTREHPVWLTAADVARLRAPVQLCVLAGCTSLGGQGYIKETLQGLSTAWLVAGARTVVATLWNADDEATKALVRAFYEELSRGRTASEALRAAQTAIRETPRWSAPYFWAGVVLLGDPDTRLPLKVRRSILPVLGGR